MSNNRSERWLSLFVVIGLGILSGCTPAGTRVAEEDPERKSGDHTDRNIRSKVDTPALGMNLSTVNDWSREWAFVDVYRSSRPWTLDTGAPAPLDKDGNPILAPGRSAWTLCVRELDGHYPEGKYVATWKGTGELKIQRWDVSRVVDSKPGRIEVLVKPGHGGIQLDLTASDPDDPVRDIHVYAPGFESAESMFHPLFVERLGPAKMLRFMDWQRTNNSPVRSWSERTKPNAPRYSTDSGVPIEVMIDLANQAKKDPWFCMPHLADDDYVQEFARLAKQRLDPDRKIYVEYSNEVWNFQFDQTKWAREKGLSQNLGEPPHARFYSQRAIEIFKIWEREFGKERLVRVLGSQAAVPWLSEQILTWRDAYRHADALAIAPYFGHDYGNPATAQRTAAMTTEEILNGLSSEVDGSNRDLIQEQAALAAKFGLKLIAYEGGQHLVGTGGAENNERLTALFHDVNHHPRMGDLYRRHLSHWDEAGGDLYVLFAYVAAPSKWGSWGLLEYQDQPVEQAPKYRAFLETLKSRKE